MDAGLNNTNQKREKTIFRITWIGFFSNLGLTALKFFAGVLGQSGAMIADAVHSLSDFLTDIAVLAFVKVSSRPSDESHDYGHGKFETLATLVIGIALLAVGIKLGWNSIRVLANMHDGIIPPRPGMIALIAAGVSIAVKEWLFWITLRTGKKVNAPSVVANAWHHRSDAFSSIATLIGIGGAYFLGEKWRILDPLAALAVTILIVKVSLELMRPALDELLEKSLSRETEARILEILTSDPEIKEPHHLKTRKIGSGCAIEVHIRLKWDMNVEQSHIVTVHLEKALKEEFGPSTQVIIHVEPYYPPTLG